MKKSDKAFNTDVLYLDWEKIYLLPFKTTLHGISQGKKYFAKFENFDANGYKGPLIVNPW